MKIINSKKELQKGSIIIGLVVVVVVIFALNYFGVTFNSVWSAIKNFFGF